MTSDRIAHPRITITICPVPALMMAPAMGPPTKPREEAVSNLRGKGVCVRVCVCVGGAYVCVWGG